VLGKYLSNGLYSPSADFNTSWSTTNQPFDVTANKIYTVTLAAFVAADVYPRLLRSWIYGPSSPQ